jgi:hypothetical protein
VTGVCIAQSGLPVTISLVGRKLPAAAYKPEVRKCVARCCPANNRASLIMYSAKQGKQQKAGATWLTIWPVSLSLLVQASCGRGRGEGGSLQARPKLGKELGQGLLATRPCARSS